MNSHAVLPEDLRGTYERAVYEAELDAGHVVFRIGQEPRGAAPPTSLAILTAWNPGHERPGEGFNRMANERLAAEIKKRGYACHPATGRTEDGMHDEPSFAVPGISIEEAAKLGRRFRQAAFFYWDGTSARILSCGPYSEPELEADAASRRAVIRFFNDALNAMDFAVLDEILAPDYIDHMPKLGQTHDAAGVRERIERLHAAFPDIRIEIEALVVQGGLAAARWRWTGTHRGRFREIEPTGRSATVAGCDFFRIENGQIAEHWVAVDEYGLLVQLGVVPAR